MPHANTPPPPPLPTLADEIARVVDEIMGEIRPRLVRGALTGERRERRNLRHADNFLSDHDLWMHGRYRELLAGVLPSFVYASEEAEPVVVGVDPDPDLCVMVDPLDTSELAVRALNGYTHVLVYSRSLARPVAAVVGDIFHHLRLYVATRGADGVDRAELLTADGERFELACRKPAELNESLVTNYLMRPEERFAPLAAQHRFLEALGSTGPDGKSRGRIGVDFGSIGLCHVAAGFTDAMVEFAKGFAVWDLAPGHYILHAAGGSVIGTDGTPLGLDYGLQSLDDIARAMNRRQKFIAAPDTDAAHAILATLDL